MSNDETTKTLAMAMFDHGKYCGIATSSLFMFLIMVLGITQYVILFFVILSWVKCLFHFRENAKYIVYVRKMQGTNNAKT